MLLLPFRLARPIAALSLVSGVLGAFPGSSTAAIPSLAGGVAEPDVCVVTREPAGRNCSAETITVEPSSGGVVNSRVVLRVGDLRISDDAQIVSAYLHLVPVGSVPSAAYQLRWGNTFDPQNDPASVFANDPYFWTGATGSAQPPSGSGQYGTTRWMVSEVLDRARARSRTPFDLYVDASFGAAPVTYYGPGAADPNMRPWIGITYRNGTGYRAEQSYSEVQSTDNHRYVVNDATGNVVVDAHDGNVTGVGPIQRFSNTLSRSNAERDAGTWDSVYDARQVHELTDSNTWWDFPTGESTSADSAAGVNTLDAGNNAIDQSNGLQQTDALWHRGYLTDTGQNVEAQDPDGIRRTYRFPVTGDGRPRNARAQGLTIASDGGDGGASLSVAIANSDAQLTITGDRGTATAAKIPAATSGETRLAGWVRPGADPSTTVDVVRYAYDDQDRLVRAVLRGVGTIRYAYSDLGLLTRVVDTDDSVVKLAYDDQGRITEIRRLPSATLPEEAAEWDRRQYIDGVEPDCAADAGTERTVRRTMSSGSRVVYCVSGTGYVIERHQSDPPLPEFEPVDCPVGETDCADPGPEQPPVATGARARRSLAACTSEIRPNMLGLIGMGNDTYRDGELTMFDRREALDCLGVKTVRHIVPWNVAAPQYWTRSLNADGTKDLTSDPANMQLRLDAARRFVTSALAGGYAPLISFDACPLDPAPETKKAPCDTPPTAAQYKVAIQAFLADSTLKRVKLFTAFNEPNHTRKVARNHVVQRIPYLSRPAPGTEVPASDKDATGPYLAGLYLRRLTQLCTGCKVYAGDLSDVEARDRPVKLETWIRQYLQGMRGTRRFGWSMHYYLSMRERSLNSAPCSAGEIKPSAQRCWGRMARILAAVSPASRALGSTADSAVSWWLTEGGEVYKQNGDEPGWSNLEFAGPGATTAYAPADRAVVRQTVAYRTQNRLLVERGRIQRKFSIAIDRIFGWELTAPADPKRFDSALFADPSRAPGNGLDDRPRPAYPALCERVRGRDAPDCWQGPGPTPIPTPTPDETPPPDIGTN